VIASGESTNSRKRTTELVNPVNRRQAFVAVAQMVLAEVSGGGPHILSTCTRVTVASFRPCLAAGIPPSLDSPVRAVNRPLMKVERPVVPLCLASSSVNIMPSLAILSMLGVLKPILKINVRVCCPLHILKNRIC